MKCRVYLRVARDSKSRNGCRVRAGVTPAYEPLHDGQNRPLPTAAFSLELDIPEPVFKHAERVLAEIEVPEELAQAAVEVKVETP